MLPKPWTQRLAAVRATAVNRVLQEARQVQAEGRSLVSLMRGQPDTPTPGHIVEAAIKALRDGHTGYPDNQGEPILRQAVAAKLEREQGLKYDPDREILITDGATAGLFCALGILLQPDDNVLLPDPIYDAYASPIALWGGRPLAVRSRIRDGRFTLEHDLLKSICTPRSRALLLNTPWNPTGTVLTRDELAACVAFAERADLYVISDEIYENLIYDGRRHVSPAAISPEARKRTLIVNSLSKTYAMTGWRVGYCAGPAEIIQAMYLVLQQFSRGPATFVQHAAAAALNGAQACVQAMRAEYQARRDRVVEALRGLPPGRLEDGSVAKTWNNEPLVPEGGLFVMLDLRGLGMRSDDVRRFLLREAGVVVIHGAAYGDGGEHTLRISFAAGGTVLEQGLQRLREGLLRLASRTMP
ncbi:MAG: aminotransferase class I/II-fold pyridoxal phosphate-dependent enzyme [Gemmataceae bacterium]|nr:aminotransferase class I/II-fold pyridoxal phosphate-dependent enzyme [Gemmataceae bacterium]